MRRQARSDFSRSSLSSDHRDADDAATVSSPAGGAAATPAAAAAGAVAAAVATGTCTTSCGLLLAFSSELKTASGDAKAPPLSAMEITLRPAAFCERT